MSNRAITSTRLLGYVLICFYTYIFLEGILRKWVLPPYTGTILYGLKYALLFIATLIYWLPTRDIKYYNNTIYEIRTYIKAYIILILLSGIIVTGIYNGAVVSLISISLDLLPIILIYVIPRCLTNDKQIDRVISVFIAISLSIFILGIIQYFSPPTDAINKYAVEMKNDRALVGDAARICGVFSYITPMGDFCIASSIIFISLLSISKKIISTSIYGSLFVLSLLVGFMTGSRTVLMLILLGSLFVFWEFGLLKRNHTFIILLCILIFGGIYYYYTYGITAIDNFLWRANMANDESMRVSKLFNFSNLMDYAGFFGYGVGFANLALQSMLSYTSELGFEEEIGRIVLEFGFGGFVLISVIRLMLWLKIIKLAKSIKNKRFNALAWSGVVIITPMTLYLQLCLYNWFAYILYFTVIGFVIALKQIDFNTYSQKNN